MRVLLTILFLFGLKCYSQDCYQVVINASTGISERVPCSQEFLEQARIDSAGLAQRQIELNKKQLTIETLLQLYDTLVVGRDVRNLTTTQQRIALGVLLIKNDMVGTDFKMK